MKRVIVTGGAGFIGSAFVWKLNQERIDDILIVDDLKDSEKWRNLAGLRFSDEIDLSGLRPLTPVSYTHLTLPTN